MFEFIPAARWSGYGTSIFTEMTELANRHNAVNLAQGFPDFPGPAKLRQKLTEHTAASHLQYAPSSGEETLRKALSQWIYDSYGVYYDPASEITVTTGATEGLYSVINAFVNPGDKVIVFEPFYDSYGQAIANAGGQVVPVRLHAPDTPLGMKAGGWAIDWASFDAACVGGARLLLLNSPHNPTGKVFSEEELQHIATGALKAKALVVTDEVYEQLVFEGAAHSTLAAFESLQGRVIRISSAAKSFGFTGLKVGWVSAAAHLTRAIRLVHQATVFCVPPNFQTALADLIAEKEWLKTYFDDFRSEYQFKRDFLQAALERSGFFVQPTFGTYFLMANYESLAGDLADVTFAKQLIETKSVVAIPTSVFYIAPPKSLPWLRFAFCKSEDTLKKAAHSLLG